MKILGIDPGLNVTGYAVLEKTNKGLKILEAGFVETSSKEKLQKRLDKIHRSLLELIRSFKPDALVLEKLYSHYRHPVTASLLGHARGVISLLAAEENVPFFEYASTRVKKSVTGKGHASKSQIQRMIAHVLGIKGEIQQDTADALAIALTHLNILESKL